jgi:NAD(P)-dependent dehydrogenase (short-subunit alcohol dehydrogenase family)
MPREEFTIRGETAVVTGAAGGIGRTIATRLSAMGVNVVANDIDGDGLADVEADCASNRGKVKAYEGDASDPETMSDLVTTTVETFDSIDILINNVGIRGPTARTEELPFDGFMRTLEINIGGPLALTKAAIPELKRSIDGRIVNISSRSAKHPQPERLPYTASKAGLGGFTRTVAVELGELGVNVNSVSPGPVEGERFEETLRNRSAERDRPVEEIRSAVVDTSPLGQLLSPDDVADAVLFLCSDQADKITGQDINVSGGRTME